MTAIRARLTRAAATATILLVALGATAASADDLSTSTSDVYNATTDATNLHQKQLHGAGVTVAVIDSGVANVAGLDGRLIHQENFSAGSAQGDEYGHGTFVAGLVHAVAPEANIVSLKLSGANGAVDVTQVLAALQWVVAHRDTYSIDVVNLSFGNDSKQSAHVSPLNFAVQQAWDAGIVVVASAGNLGPEPGTVTKPGDDPLIISVGSSQDKGTGVRGDDALSGFSSSGPTQDGLQKPDMVGPGTRVVSLRAPGSTIDAAYPQARIGEDHFRGSGTSFSAPIVTGIVAQMLGADPSLDPDQVKHGLLAGATAIDGAKDGLGHGTVRAARALSYATGGRANAGVTRSSGRGSIEEDRGSARIETTLPVLQLDGLVEWTPVALSGERTAEIVPSELDAPNLALGDDPVEGLDPFLPDEFVDRTTWNASQWGASQWGASQWGASQWGASQWGASQWGASEWWASQWG